MCAPKYKNVSLAHFNGRTLWEVVGGRGGGGGVRVRGGSKRGLDYQHQFSNSNQEFFFYNHLHAYMPNPAQIVTLEIKFIFLIFLQVVCSSRMWFCERCGCENKAVYKLLTIVKCLHQLSIYIYIYIYIYVYIYIYI